MQSKIKIKKKKRHWERGSIVGVLPKLSDQQVVFLQLDLTKSPQKGIRGLERVNQGNRRLREQSADTPKGQDGESGVAALLSRRWSRGHLGQQRVPHTRKREEVREAGWRLPRELILVNVCT